MSEDGSPQKGQGSCDLSRVTGTIRQQPLTHTPCNHMIFLETDGDPGRTRTPDPLIRSQLLYPAELPGHTCFPTTMTWG